MNSKKRIANMGLVLALTVSPCLSQVPAARQQELASHIQKAQQYLRNKQPDLAVPELQAAVAIDPDNVEAQGNLGVLLCFQEKFADAIPHLQAALNNQPALANIQGLLGIAELRTSNFVDARKNLEASVPVIPDRKFKIHAGLELVGLDTRNGDLDQAAAVISGLRQVDPGNAELLYAAYRTYSDLSSQSMLALALADPNSAQMHQLLAHEEIRQRNTNAAIAQYRKAVAIDPHLSDVHSDFAQLLKSSQDPRLQKEAERESQAALAVKHHDADCRSEPTDSDANPDLGKSLTERAHTARCEEQRGDTEAARGELEALVPELNEPAIKVEAGMELIEIYGAANELEQAATVVAMLLESAPADPRVLYTAYRTYSDLAAGATHDLSLTAPASGQMYQATAHESVKKGDLPGAIVDFRKALATDPHLAGIHFELAEALHASADLAVRGQAEAEYKLAIAANHQDEKAWTRLGDIAADQGSLDEAAGDYTRASQILATDTDPVIGMARIDLERNNPAAAAALLEVVVASDPSNVLAHYRLSAAYRRLNRPEDSRRELDAYKKYKSLKESLRTINSEMRADPASP